MGNAITVKDVTKIYKMYEKPIDRLKESLHPAHREYHKKFYALNNLSFQVKKGETVGIIGTNGSGKSTILKIITGVLSPTTGTVEVEGNISALLELGAGFNSDYTGIENIFMNGTMMGFSRKEMDKKLQDILDFADIGDFVHQPVKTYSSGMHSKLAFSITAVLESDIMLIDEVLSVGDARFKRKSYRKMKQLISNEERTVVIVSHSLETLRKLCTSMLWLHNGKVKMIGEPGKVLDAYEEFMSE